jgi:MFS family permease
VIPILKNRNLLLLWSGQFVAQTGDFLFQATVLFLILTIEPIQGSLKAGMVSFLQTLPFLIFGLVAGSLVDRYRRRSIMLLSDAARGLLLLAVPFLWQAGFLSWGSLGVLAFVLSSFSTLFNPARDALIPELVPRDRLLQANALIQTSAQLAMITGTFLAGALLSVQQTAQSNEPSIWSMIRLLVFDGLGYFVSFFTILLMRTRSNRPPASSSLTAQQKPHPENRPSVLQGLTEGLHYVAGAPLLVGLLLLTAIDNFFIMGPAVVGANLFIKETLHLTAQYYAYFQGALALGWFGGTLWVSRYGKHFPKGKLLLIGIVMDGATYLPFVSFLGSNSYPLALLLIFVHGLFIPLITVMRTSLIQETVPATHLGKVLAMVNLAVVGFMALSSFTTGVLGEVLAPPILFTLAGAGGAISGLIGWMVFRTLRGQP